MVLSKKGQLTLPSCVRRQLKLAPGDHFEVTVEDEHTITLRCVSHPPNRGLVDLLLACPSPLAIQEQDADDSPPLAL
jgi:AbrB family looped-hinge helix DNA binding protein